MSGFRAIIAKGNDLKHFNEVSADYVKRDRFSVQRYTALPMEPLSRQR